MIDVPVILIVYNRPQHTAKVLESLKRHNIQNLHIFSDAAKSSQYIESVRQVRNLIHSIDWCKPVITERAENFGLAKSIVSAADAVLEKYNKFILLEDDCVAGEYFFDYIADCLKKYEYNEKVFGISGYSVQLPEEIIQRYPHDVYFSPRIGSCGWATWKRAWQHYDRDLMNVVSKAVKNNIDLAQGGNDFPGYITSYLQGNKKDVWTLNWVVSVYLNNGVYVYPTRSHIENIGHDGSGLHCSSSHKFDSILCQTKPSRYPANVILSPEIMQAFKSYYSINQNSSDKAVSALKNITHYGCMKILHICSLDQGGAGIAAYRLHKALQSAGMDSKMLVLEKAHCDDSVLTAGRNSTASWQQIWDRWSCLMAGCNNRPAGLEIFSDFNSDVNFDLIQAVRQADILNFHWVSGMLDAEKLPKVFADKPVVWTLHDMNPFTGGCHYSSGCQEYEKNCAGCFQLGGDNNTAETIWQAKQNYYKDMSITPVAPSKWLGRCAGRSSLFKNRRIEVIPNGIELDMFRPLDKNKVRRAIGIEKYENIILFTADNAANHRKGFSNLCRLLEQFNDLPQNTALAVLGSVGNMDMSKLNLPVITFGRLNNPEHIVLAYNTADVFVLPSLEDNLPNTILESLACGVPVVANNIGGVPDIIEHCKTGYLADVNDSRQLADGIKWALNAKKNSSAGHNLTELCRQRACQFSVENQAQNYIALYSDVLQKTKPAATSKTQQENYPKITIITPSFNQAGYLERCIKSVLSQNYPNLEYIVIDGGSTDGSVDIIKKYQSQLTCWLSEPDRGQYDALNKGFAKSTGDIMGWLNSDDMLHEGSLWRLADVFGKNPDVDFITGRRVGFDSSDNLKFFKPGLIRWSRRKLLDKQTIHKHELFVMQEATYWRRSLWQKAGGRLDTDIKLAADFELWLRLSRYAKLHTVDTTFGGFRSYSIAQRCQQFRAEYISECDAVIDKELLNESQFDTAEAPEIISYDSKQSNAASSCDLSIVLCTMNRAGLLDDMLNSLAIAAKGLSYEVIAVIGNCTDNTLAVLQKHNVSKIYNEAEFLGSGKHSWPQLYNFAFSKASGKWAMFASDDIVFEPNCLKNAVKVLSAQPDSVAGGIFFYKNLWEHSNRPAYDRNKYFVAMGYEFNILMNYGLLRLDCFRQVGGFDENYNFYYADSDLCNRLYAADKILLPLAGSLVLHNDKLDNLKQDNFSRVDTDLQLYRSKWGRFYVDEKNRPARLVWQKDIVNDLLPPVGEKLNFAAMQLYWRGLSFYQRGQFAQASQQFACSIQQGGDNLNTYHYLAKSLWYSGDITAAEKIIAGKKLELQLSRPKQKNCAIIFSKDRPLQLQATIESFFARCKNADNTILHVLYKTSNDFYQKQYNRLREKFDSVIFVSQSGFKADVLKILCGFETVLFLVDDAMFVSDFDLQQVYDVLHANVCSIGFSLRLGKNTGYCYSKDSQQQRPAFENIDSNILQFDWTASQFDFGYPLEVSSSVYRVADIFELISKLPFDNPNDFEDALACNANLFATAKPKLLCFEKSVAFCNPVNKVQSVRDNRSSVLPQYSEEKLAELFVQHNSIDIDRYKNFVPNSCHQEMELYFRAGNPKPVSVKITVEMVAYNAEKYIARAIDSVLAQSFADFELLIVDDGSTDSTAGIIKSFSDSRIRFLTQKHKGLAAGRNLAVSSARGEYIVCVDSDDFISEDYLKQMFTFAQANEGFDYYYPRVLSLVDSADKISGDIWEYNNFADSRILPSVLFANGFSPIPIVGSFIRKTMFARLGLYEDCNIFEDFAYLCRNALKMKFKMADLSAKYFYRILPESASNKSQIRDSFISQKLNEMLRIYSPQVICPQLVNITDAGKAKQVYYKYIVDIFTRHAGGFHKVKHGHYFQQFADIYKNELAVLSRQDMTDTAINTR